MSTSFIGNLFFPATEKEMDDEKGKSILRHYVAGVESVRPALIRIVGSPRQWEVKAAGKDSYHERSTKEHWMFLGL